MRMDGEHVSLAGFRQQYYGGRAWADELARRGFVVIVPDAFYWGERRLQYEHPPEALQERSLPGLKPEGEEYVRAMNAFLREQTAVLQTWLAFAGTSWMGIVNYDDRRSVDVLVSLPEVDRDPHRLRRPVRAAVTAPTYMTGMEPRLKASVIIGWMTSLPTTWDIPYIVHSSLFDAFSAHANLDHPDIATLGAPGCALLVQNCAQDRLFTRAGMDAAAREDRRGVFRTRPHGTLPVPVLRRAAPVQRRQCRRKRSPGWRSG